MPELVKGRVLRILYNEGDYYVLNLSDAEDKGKPLTARGNVYGLIQLKAGVTIQLFGSWRKHSKYGLQFNFKTWRPWAEKAEDVEEFLHVCVDGFSDRSVAKAVAEEHGTDAFEAMAKSEEVSEEVALAWSQAVATRDLTGLLASGGLSNLEIRAVMRHFGLEAAAIIQDNPFRVSEVGVPLGRADQLALKLGATLDDPRRIGGAVLWMLRRQLDEGHLYHRRGDIPRLTNRALREEQLVPLMLGANLDQKFAEVIQELVDGKLLVLDPDHGVYLPEPYLYERESAKILAGLLAPSDIDLGVEPFIQDYERENHITLSSDQRRAVEELTKHRVLVLTGLPGTGKTTCIRAIVRFLEEGRLSFSLMAPTGIAAKRLAAIAGHSATTIHRALRYDGDEWGHHEGNRYIVDAVIVDEVSMVDQELLYRLLSSLRSETILVLVGDDAQLPSVGPGNVLRELVACPEVPSVRLTKIFRQSERGEIVTNSHRINRGEMPELLDPRKDKTEFKFLQVSDEERIVELILRMAATLKGRDANFQILSPKYAGTVGVDNLNDRLRDQLNPEGPPEWAYGEQRFRLGDRLMVVRNDYQRAVYNGDVGKLIRIGKKALTVRIHGFGGQDVDTEVEFPSTVAADKLRLAYAVTVHKSQGNEFDTIIMPIVRAQGRMLQRNLLYTAVTRARKSVWLIGEVEAVQRAVSNNKVVQRNTALLDTLRGLAAV